MVRLALFVTLEVNVSFWIDKQTFLSMLPVTLIV